MDDEKLMAQCFKHDQKLWKLDRISKSDAELKETLNVLMDNYKLLKDLFLWTASQSSKYPFITPSAFSRFAEFMKD